MAGSLATGTPSRALTLVVLGVFLAAARAAAFGAVPLALFISAFMFQIVHCCFSDYAMSTPRPLEPNTALEGV